MLAVSLCNLESRDVAYTVISVLRIMQSVFYKLMVQERGLCTFFLFLTNSIDQHYMRDYNCLISHKSFWSFFNPKFLSYRKISELHKSSPYFCSLFINVCYDIHIWFLLRSSKCPLSFCVCQ